MTRSYNSVTKFLHWLIFMMVSAQYAVGEFMPHIGRDTPNTGLVAIHISLGGFTMLAVAVAILVRLLSPVPQLPELPRWQRFLATLTHWSLYALILVMALLGWAATNSRGWAITLFGIDLPMVASKGERWAHEAGDVHMFLVNILLGLVAMHVGAALYHHFIRRDAVLKRILPG
jgi:cytochrome b561